MPRKFVFPFLALAALAACARSHEVVAPPSAERPSDAWRTLITEDDRGRLRHWRNSWTDALAAARPGNEAAIAREGPLLDPDAALPGMRLARGDYRCRAIKLGAQSPRHPVFDIYEWRACSVASEGSRLHFTIATGPQRALGALFPDIGRRMVFLGTLQLGDEALAYRYGRDRERDLVGLLERVGERRWRLVLPAPHFESLLDVIEIVPAR